MEEVIVWKKYELEKPNKAGAYLHCLGGRVEVHWYQPKDDCWYSGISGNMDDVVDHPELWSEMPNGRTLK